MDKIKQKIENLNENLKNIIIPEEAIPETIIENDIIKQNNNLTNYGVEFYFYVWEEMNAPWFTNYGTAVNIVPSIDNIANENGEINLIEGNENFINDEGLGKENDREGKRLFEGFIKNNRQVYSYKLGNYRTYILDILTKTCIGYDFYF